MRAIRVLEILSGFAVEGPLGGIERFGVELARALDHGQIEPIVYGMWSYQVPNEDRWLGALREEGVEAFMPAPWREEAPYRSFAETLRATRAYLRGRRVDIIHSHCQFGDVVALLLRRRLGARAVVRTVHNEREWRKRPGRRLLLTNLLYPLLFDAELGVSQQVVDNLQKRPVSRLVRQRVYKRYNALNFARFEGVSVDRDAKKASLGIPAGAAVVGTVGRLTEQKGYHVLLEAAASVISQRPDTYFLIIGSGEREEALRSYAAELEIGQRVIFTGKRDDVEECLQIMDLFASSSLWEGLPTVILESMASRVPVIATRVSGNTELVEDGLTGRLVPPGDAEHLAYGILELLAADAEETAAMCARAYRYVRNTFSIERVARQHEALYRELAEG
ncbi:MAG: glycosyltransferase [Candidatus Promineifilaceae bacterium]|nr:glycosyltransferase [Candidatus Promineifilaceae bacterium]